MSAMPLARLLPFAPAVQAQLILTVEFRSPDGRSWQAVGGGDTLQEAIDWARESCPRATAWAPVGWDHLYCD